MSSRRLILLGLIIGLAAPIAACLIATHTFAASTPSASITNRELAELPAKTDTTLHYDSPDGFNAFALVWPETPSDGWEARTQTVDGVWSDWEALEPMEPAQPTEASSRTPSELRTFDAASAVEIRYPEQDADRIADTTFVAIDTRTHRHPLATLVEKLFPVHSAVASDLLTIVSRNEWGADESLRFWDPEYATPEKFIIHHTAGSNGGSDPEATIRAIDVYHSQTLGWGDIGYNYLVDPSGTIYEGRYGGDGVIGAHAYDDIHHMNYNPGTIGISLLGNYTSTQPTQAALDAIARLIGTKAALFSIDPSGSSRLRDLPDTIPNIVGHRDVDATACPGDKLYAKLSSIRDAASSIAEEGASIVKSAARVSASSIVMSAAPYDGTTVTFKYRNTSNVTWTHYSDASAPRLVAVGNSALQGDGWISDSVVTTMTHETVAPGEVTKFTFSINVPADAESVTQTFRLEWDEDALANTSITLTVAVDPTSWSSRLVSHSIPDAMFAGDGAIVELKFENIGTQTWDRDGIRLVAYDLGDAPSVYRDASWSSATGSFGSDYEHIGTGEVATYRFRIMAPSHPGQYRQLLRLVRSDGTVIPGSRVDLITDADSHFQGSIRERSIPDAVLNYWRVPVAVRIKNTGIAAWDRSIVLRVYDLGYHQSLFRDGSWPTASGDIPFEESIVPPGSTATFRFSLDAPTARGTYKNIYRLEVRGRSDIVIQNASFEQNTRVD